MIKKRIFIVLIFNLILLVNFAQAQQKIEIQFFYSETCPHCAQEKKFLESLVSKYPEARLQGFNVSRQENVPILIDLYEKHEVPEDIKGLVPITFIDGEFFLGYGGDEKTGKKIEDYIQALIEAKEFSPDNASLPNGLATPIDLEKKIKIPILGEIELSTLSPLGLAVVLGVLDGFNACAMVALGFLLAILISTGIREKVFLIGGTFILVSGIVYFLFISAWFNLLAALEKIKIITFLAGAIIVFFAILMLKDYFGGVVCKLCEVRPGRETIFVRLQRNLFKKMEKAIKSEASLPLVLLGVAGVAAGVNMVELVCSFGFPLAFTKVLAGFNLSSFSYYIYLLIYIVFYMLDDFLIFSFAVLTLKITQASQKYLKAIKLVSGVVLLVLGLVMIFKPEILVFG